MKMQFIDLKRQYARMETDIRQRMDAVLAHGKFIMGPEIAELETALAAFTGSSHAVTCASGTDALLMALMAQGVGPGDAVITTPFTFIATAEVISLLGATPVFVDADPETFNLDHRRLEAAMAAVESANPDLHPLPKAARDPKKPLHLRGIIPVDLFGLPCDYERINALAKKRGLFVIEDGAQSFGASRGGKMACTLAETGCASFFPAKPLGCYGDGGAVFTNDPDTAECLRSIRVHGKGNDKYDNVRIGLNARLDTLQAAILLAKLEVFPDELEKRRHAAGIYAEILKDLCSALATQKVASDAQSAWAQYSLLAPKASQRQDILSGLKEEGIPSAVYYPAPLHAQRAFASQGMRPEDLPVSLDLSQRIFSLPMHPYLKDEEIRLVGEALARSCEKAGI